MGFEWRTYNQKQIVQRSAGERLLRGGNCCVYVSIWATDIQGQDDGIGGSPLAAVLHRL
jgi:hypothetical protein